MPARPGGVYRVPTAGEPEFRHAVIVGGFCIIGQRQRHSRRDPVIHSISCHTNKEGAVGTDSNAKFVMVNRIVKVQQASFLVKRLDFQIQLFVQEGECGFDPKNEIHFSFHTFLTGMCFIFLCSEGGTNHRSLDLCACFQVHLHREYLGADDADVRLKVKPDKQRAVHIIVQEFQRRGDAPVRKPAVGVVAEPDRRFAVDRIFDRAGRFNHQ